ncbi:MAG: hypothetical protein IJI48_01990 [Ruminococcus sp.]|nr:hypothetical protein [Ruminococcus sp.]
MKRLLVLLLCITTLLSVTSLPALAAEAQYRADDTATVSEVSEDTDDEAEVDELTPKEDEEIADTGWSLLTEAQFSSKLDQLRANIPTAISGAEYTMSTALTRRIPAGATLVR